MRVSIIIPVYNEEKTIQRVIEAVRSVDFGFDAEREIIVVDDSSSDNTLEILKNISEIEVIRHSKNQGKGAALKSGFQKSSGDIILVQDADLEYDPADLPALLKPILDGVADVVVGNRFLGKKSTVVYFRNFIGNKFITFFSNLFTGLKIGDVEVGYKIFRKEVINSFKDKLESKRFGIEPELIARIARGKDENGNHWRVKEVPINYYGRSYEDGKKIGIWDGIKAIFVIIYYNIF
ncbi:glycosyltransferase family 2 protein [Patescibacteria group bacterium]